MLVIESATQPGKVMVTHHDHQQGAVLVAYPAAAYAVWKGSGRVPGPDLEPQTRQRIPPDIPDGYVVIRPIEPEA